MDIVWPRWLEALPEEEQTEAKAKFLVRLASLHFSQTGHVQDLSLACDLAARSLSQLDSVSPELAIKLEGLLGIDRFPRSLFRPDLFLIPEG